MKQQNEHPSYQLPIQVLIVDPYEIVRCGTRIEIENHPDFTVVGEANSGQTALNMVEQLRPDIILLEPFLDDMKGIEVVRQIKAMGDSAPQVLVFATQANRQLVYSLLNAGAQGYVLKNDSPTTLLQALQGVMDGDIVMSPRVQTVLVTMLRSLQNDLSNAEVDVLRQIGRGKSNAQVARRLHISVGTVQNHLSNIYRKLPPVRSRAEAVAWVWLNGLMA